MSTFALTPIQNAPVTLRFLLRMVEHMGSAIQITTPHDVFGVRRKCCIMIESLKDFTSMRPIATACLDAYIMYLYTRMESARTLNLYKFLDSGSISCGSSKEERAQLLTARLLGTDYDQLLLFPYNSGSFNIMNKKKPALRVVKCPKQSGVVECGYYVMRFMRDIIMSTSTSIIQIGSTYIVLRIRYFVTHFVTYFVIYFAHILSYILSHIFVFELPWKIQCWRKIQLSCSISMSVVDKDVVDLEMLLLILKCVDKGLNKAKGNPMAFYKVLPQSIGAMKPWIRQLVDV
ncbi:hypothetical protein IC575_000753 [Cucumis melo]